jgi:N-succinyldiaminopimelate aminotransferase
MRVDPETMVTVTSGATEALCDAVLGLVDPGEEVILFEPYFDSYVADVLMAGGIPKYVVLRPPDGRHSQWWFDEGELISAFSAKTKALMLNTPHNPTGKVYTRDELGLIADLAKKYGAVVISDEVYEHIVFEPAQHIPIATLPGMADRTITISSGGKTFSLTGWKIGWAISAPELRPSVLKTHQFVTFATSSPFQEAIGAALRLPDSYFANLVKSYREKRRQLCDALAYAGLQPVVPEGTYYTMANTAIAGFDNDVDFCRYLTTEVGVCAIPPSPFYSPEHAHHAKAMARFTFCKTAPVLETGVERLRRYGESLKKKAKSA